MESFRKTGDRFAVSFTLLFFSENYYVYCYYRYRYYFHGEAFGIVWALLLMYSVMIFFLSELMSAGQTLLALRLYGLD